MLLCNTFSLAMFDSSIVRFEVKHLTLEQAQYFSTSCRSVVGHADTAKLFGGLLGKAVAFNRESVSACHEQLLIGQYTGPRLPEGVTTLPEGAMIRWILVTPMTMEDVRKSDVQVCFNGPS